MPGELTIVTGVPNSGKSEWIDALLANLTELHGWTFAMCSMEKKVRWGGGRGGGESARRTCGRLGRARAAAVGMTPWHAAALPLWCCA